MKKSEILDTVIDYLIKESGLQIAKETVNADANLQETFDLDSMQSVSMIMDMEEEYDISIDTDEIGDLQTIGDLVNLIEKSLLTLK